MKPTYTSISKLIPIIGSFLLSLLLLSPGAFAQEQIVIPLSNPGQPGQLSLNMVRGSLQVSGHDGDEVIIRYDNGQTSRPADEENSDGLRRIGRSASGFEVNEINNRVDITNVSPVREISFEIMVPHNFSLKLSMVSSSTFLVENVRGDLEINHVNGAIELVNIGGSAMVNSVNGNILATFASVAQDKPMAFSNVNGSIDISLPASTPMRAKLRSEWGEMFTDFDIDLQQGEQVNRGRTGSGGYRVSVNNWVLGDINGGGPEYLIKTLRGNIYLRKR